MSKSWKLTWLILGIPPVIVGLGALSIPSLDETGNLGFRDIAFFIAIGATFLLLGAYGVAYPRRYLVKVDGDYLIYQSIIRTRIIKRDEIDYQFRTDVEGMPTLFIYRKNDNWFSRINMPLLFQTDAEFDNWFANIPSRPPSKN